MPLPAAAQAAFDNLPTAAATAAAQAIGQRDRIIDAYLNGRPLPRNDAQFKEQQRQLRRAQRRAGLAAQPIAERYGIRIDARAGLWTLYLDNEAAATSTDLPTLERAYPEILHQHLVAALRAIHHTETTE